MCLWHILSVCFRKYFISLITSYFSLLDSECRTTKQLLYYRHTHILMYRSIVNMLKSLFQLIQNHELYCHRILKCCMSETSDQTRGRNTRSNVLVSQENVCRLWLYADFIYLFILWCVHVYCTCLWQDAFILLTSSVINMLGPVLSEGWRGCVGMCVCSKVQLQGAVLREQLSRRDCG